jgi:hypothetical protein
MPCALKRSIAFSISAFTLNSIASTKEKSVKSLKPFSGFGRMLSRSTKNRLACSASTLPSNSTITVAFAVVSDFNHSWLRIWLARLTLACSPDTPGILSGCAHIQPSRRRALPTMVLMICTNLRRSSRRVNTKLESKIKIERRFAKAGHPPLHFRSIGDDVA